MSYFNSQGEAIPEHLWRLGLAVRALIEQYDAMEKWRRHVRGWVKHVREAADDPERAGIVVTYLPQTLRIDEEYALLAAVHDNCASPKREELIHPWAAEEDFTEPDKLTPEVLDGIGTYIHLMKQILPEQGLRRGIERSKADRLVEILRHVANDVRDAARLWTPDRSINAGESEPEIVDEYESFLRRMDTETDNGGKTVAHVLEYKAVGGKAVIGSLEEQGQAVKQVDKFAATYQGIYCPQLVGNKIDDPTNPLTAAQIAKAIWYKDDDAARKRAREWMEKGKLPANLADGLKDHYVVSDSALSRLAAIEGGALNSRR